MSLTSHANNLGRLAFAHEQGHPAMFPPIAPLRRYWKRIASCTPWLPNQIASLSCSMGALLPAFT